MTRAARLGLLLLLLMGLTGCGGTDTDAASSPSPSASPSEPISATGTTATPQVSLNSCAVVTAAMLNRDLGSAFTDGTSTRPRFSDPATTDCSYDDGFDTNDVIVSGTTRAATDLSAAVIGHVDGVTGTQRIPGADRGLAEIIARHHGETDGDVSLVVGDVGFIVDIGLDRRFTLAQLLALAHDLVTAIKAR